VSSPAVRCDAQKEDAITVIIARDGTVYFRNYRTTFDDLPRAIEEAVRDGAERKVYVKAEARARYSDVEQRLTRYGWREFARRCFY